MAIATCTLSGNVKNLLGSAVQNCTIRVSTLTPFFHTGTFISGEVASVVTNATGDFSLTVIETTTVGRNLSFTFDYYDGVSNRRQKTFAAVVPNASSAFLSDIVNVNTILAGAPSTFPATNVNLVPISGLTSTTAQAAFSELLADITSETSTRTSAVASEAATRAAADTTIQTQVTTNTTNIATNTSNISTNTSNIATNASTMNTHIASTSAHGATSANTASAIVARDASGNFSAGTITANVTGALTGNASTATTAGNVTGTVAIANGGTGQTSQQAALNALTGTQSAGKVLRSDGTNATLSAIQASDVPTLNQNTTGTASNVTGTVAIANGGTGQITQQAALNALAGTQSSGKYLRSDGTNTTLSTIAAADVPTLNQNTTGSAASFTGSLSGDVTGTQGATVVSQVGGKTASTVAGTVNTVAAATNLATGSTLALRDANGNVAMNNLTEGFATTATAGGTTVLTVASPYTQQFTGTTVQTVQLPSATTLVLGQAWMIANRSTQTVTVKDAAGGTVQVMAAGSQVVVTCASIGTSAGVWDAAYSTTSGGGGGTGLGAKNYITNYNLEAATTAGFHVMNVALTNGVPSAAPTISTTTSGASAVDLTTASKIDTFGVSAPGKLSGSYSLNVSGSAITAGQGFITDAFTIDREDVSKVLSGRFTFEVTANPTMGNFSGTSSNSFGVFIYDIANSAWIMPAGSWGMTQSTGPGACQYTFQTPSNATSFRVAVVCINTTGALALSINYDSFSLGPQAITQGTPMSDWVAYTPTITGTTTNPTLGTGGYLKAYYRRIGDSMAIRYEYSQTAAGTAGSGIYLLSLPPGYSIDTSKISGTGNITQNLGSFYALTAGTTDDQVGNIQAYDAQRLQAFLSGPAAAGNAWSSTNTLNFGLTSLYFGVSAFIPISGWSSQVQMSSDTDTRVVAFRAQRSQSCTGSADNVIAFASGDITKDSTGSFNTANSKYVANTTGYYFLNTVADTGTTTGLCRTKYRINGGGWVLVGSNYYASAPSSSVFTSGSDLVYLNAGDTVEFGLFPGATVTATYTASIQRLSGPSVIAATETVGVHACWTATIAATTGTRDLIATSNSSSTRREFDTHGSYNTTTGVWTCPTSGKYRFLAYTIFNGSKINNNVSSLLLANSSNTTIKELGRVTTGTNMSADYAINGAVEMSCLAGEQFKFRVSTLDSLAIYGDTSGGYGYVNILRVGN